MTKTLFAGFFKKAIPIVGGIVGGGITFFSFKPCCYRLKNVLQDTMDAFVTSITKGTVIDVDYGEIIPDDETDEENVK